MPAAETDTKTKPEKDAKTGRFQTGNIGGPGRPKGSRNKLGEAFIQDLYENWIENGVETIEAVRVEKPDQYLKVVASILPQKMEIKTVEGDLSDEQLAALITAVDAAMAIRSIAEDAGSGRPGGGGKAPKGRGRKAEEAE